MSNTMKLGEMPIVEVQSVLIYYSDGTIDRMSNIKGAKLSIMKDNNKICDFHVQGEFHPFDIGEIDNG